MPPQPGMHDPCKVFCDREAVAQGLIRDRPDVRVVAAVNPFAQGHALIIPTGPYNSIADYVVTAPETSNVDATLARIINAIGDEWGWPVGVLEHGPFTQNVPHGHLQVYYAKPAEARAVFSPLDAPRTLLDELGSLVGAGKVRKVFEGGILDFTRGAFANLNPQFGYLAAGHFEGPVELPTLTFYDPSGFGADNRQPGILRALAAELVGRPYLAKSGKIPSEHQAMVDGWTAETKRRLSAHFVS